MIVFGDKEAARQISKAAGHPYNPEFDTSIVRYEAGKLVGGWVFSGYTGVSIGIIVASFAPRWLNRDLLWLCFDYPFMQLGVRKIVEKVSSGNPKSLELAKGLGLFKIEAIIEDVFPDGDCVILTLEKSECRWLDILPRGVRSNRGSLEDG